jgi:outer membrane protein insertion porin family/translocation and assembly module TamA
LCVLALFGLASCIKQPYPAGRDLISDVEVKSDGAVEPSAVEEGLATHPPPFPKALEGVLHDYQVFDESVLARDLERVERYYRARGYYEAKVRAGRVLRVDERHVRVEILVDEGPVVRVASPPEIRGAARLPHEVGVAVFKAVTIDPGDVFDEAVFEKNAKRLREVLGNAGYAFAEVEHKAKVDLSTHTAKVSFEIRPGKTATYGPVKIVGLESIPERPVREALAIRQGRPYSQHELDEAKEALQNLGVFASVEIREEKGRPESGEVPITVVVREGSLRTLRLGGGATFDVLRLSNHLRAGWEHRNFLGGMRRFTVEARPGVTYFPTRIGRFDSPTRLLPENRIRTELRQPSFIEGRTAGFVSGEYRIYPLLYPLPDGADPEKERVIGYHEVRASTGLERAFLSHHLFVTPSYHWQANFPFTYQGNRPAGLDNVRVSFPELHAFLDLRDDRIQPHEGLYLSNTLQVAGFWFRGTVSDVRVRSEARAYLPMSRRVTLATRLTTGFLFPSNYGETLEPGNQLAATDPTNPEVIRDQHKLLFRAFYSGGPSSNRGYPYRGVGPHGPVGFLVPTGQDCSNPQNLPPACIRPLGGLTLWEASVEVRYPILGPLHGATFVDASDVTREVGKIRANVPHISPGLGLRYATPVGPLRLDAGYRTPWLQQLGKEDLNRNEGNPGTVFGLPIAIHIALGEDF